MATTRTLGSRKSVVLRAIVTDYIRTAEPVGSTQVAGRHRLGVSPATIRNDMAALEEMGFLIQPHTSAGRIPTDLGYRFFVDTLPPSRLTETQRRAIGSAFREPPGDLQEALRLTAHLLSRLTRCGAVTTGPGSEHVFVGGAANIASEQAFERRETVRRLFEALEEEGPVVQLLRGLASSGDVVVVIGHENPLHAMWEASVVVAPLRAGRQQAGAVAVLGPTRMHYPTAISAARTVAGRASDLIERLAG
jgi:transcriptional regulator of heat shock response